MATFIANIDKGLGVLYTKHNRNDYYPNGKTKPGLFALWCDDQGFDEIDVKDEMNTSAEDCTLVTFCNTESFPFSHEIKGKNAEETNILKQIEIYKIMKLLSKSSMMKGKQKRDPNTHYKHPNNINLYFKPSDYKQSVDLYTKHVYYTLGQHGINEQSLMNILTVSTVNNGFPFLRYMVDAFQRDRIKYNFEAKNVILSINDWFISNSFCQYITKRDPNKAQELKQAMISYCNRIAPLLQFAQEIKINDSIKTISQYLVAATQFIVHIMDQQKSVPPFQYDVVIRFYGVEDNSNSVSPINNDDTKRSDDIDYNYDYVGNVMDKIETEKCAYHLDAIPHELKATDNETESDLVSRAMINAYRLFQRNVFDAEPNKYKDTMNDSKEKDKVMFKWPSRRRFCAFVDRKDVMSNKSDDLLFYEPPKDVKILPLPSQFVGEWHFESLRKCIIPRIGYGDGTDEAHNIENIRNIEAKERSTKATITSTEACYGQIGTFSFQVTQRDEMSCYFFWNGQQLRFYPQDILQVFPYIFTDKVSCKTDDKTKELVEDNCKFVESLEAKALAKSMIIQDFQFESWYRDLCKVDDFPKYND